MSSSPIFMDSYVGDSVRRKALKEAVLELMKKGVLREVENPNTPGYYGRLFIRPKPNGKWRSIIDLSGLNEYIYNPTFQMETPMSIQHSMRPGMWVTKFDLTDAYFHIPMHKSMWKYLRVALCGMVLCFVAMPMGLNVSGRIYTKVALETLKMMRARRIHIHGYMDDWLPKGYNPSLLKEQTLSGGQLAVKLGWIINMPKSVWEPTQHEVYVGIEYDLERGLALAPEKRLDVIESIIKAIIQKKGATARKWASLLGKLGSLMKQVHLGPLHRRTLQKFLQQRWDQKNQRWNEFVPLEDSIIPSLRWWINRNNTQGE